MRHCPDGVGVTALATWASPLGRRRRSVHRSAKMTSPRRFGAFVYTVGLLRCCGQMWGRRSVHKSVEMVSQRRFGAFVYTVVTRVAIRIATRAAPGGTSASAATACRRRPLAGPSRLVRKTGSARVAPLPGWHLRRGVNPHEPPKSQKWDLFKAERTVASTLARLHEHMEFHRFNPNATEICIFLCHDQVPVQ